MSIESPTMMCGTSFIATVNVGQTQLGTNWEFIPDELNSIAMDLMRRIWEFGGNVIAVKKLAEDGSWEIRFCSDQNGTNVSAVTMRMIPYKCISVQVRGERYEIHTDEELKMVIPNDRMAFLNRFRINEKEFARSLPRTIARNTGRPVS